MNSRLDYGKLFLQFDGKDNSDVDTNQMLIFETRERCGFSNKCSKLVYTENPRSVHCHQKCILLHANGASEDGLMYYTAKS